MSELNGEDYFPPVTQSEDYENEEIPGDDGPTEYLSDDDNLYNTFDGIPYQDKNRLVGKIFAAWERYKPILYRECYRPGYMLYVDDKKYAY